MALQGHGGVDMLRVFNANQFGRPGHWTDGPRDARHDLLARAPGATPVARRAALSVAQPPEPRVLADRLFGAIKARSPERVRELLAAGADPNAESGNGYPMLHLAAERADAACARALLEYGADPRGLQPEGQTPLVYAREVLQAVPRDAEGVVQARIDATLALLGAAEAAAAAP